MINKHKSNKIKENSNTVRHLNNGTDHRHSKSCCDQSSTARRTITGSYFVDPSIMLFKWFLTDTSVQFYSGWSHYIYNLKITWQTHEDGVRWSFNEVMPWSITDPTIWPVWLGLTWIQTLWVLSNPLLQSLLLEGIFYVFLCSMRKMNFKKKYW